MFDDIKKLKYAPQQLNILGRITKADDKSIVVIGTRTMSNYGKDVINSFVPALVEEGFTIVSGLALGCDSYAQEVALRNGGRTVGVLGFGVNHVKGDYNYAFIKRVYDSDRGVIVSPYKRTTRPSKFTFIYRNSIMAAIGKAVLVIEARKRSGVFYTVNAALDLGKEVFAVPGSIFRYNSVGANDLLREGATPATVPEDVFI